MKAWRIVFEEVAVRHTAPTALLLYKEKLTKGEFPTSLPDFGLVSKDPVTGEPLRYRVDDKWIYLYGVGADGRDDGLLPGKDAGGLQFPRQ